MRELTLEQLKEMGPGIFAQGEIEDSPEGINMMNTGKLLRWVAVRGGIWDWAIYCHFANKSFSWIRNHGDKVHHDRNIKKLISCNEKAFAMYRH